MPDKVTITPKIMELQDSNDIYMLMNLCILSNDVNYNKAQFTDDYIEGIINNKETYIGLPFQVNREKLENEEYDSLTHEYKDGQLKTDSIGTFVDFWSEEIDGATCLMGSIKIWKRYPNTCAAIFELYNNGGLESSCEVLVNKYKEITEDGVRVIDYNSGKNPLIASCIVTHPAEERARATMLIAEALEKDLGEKGGEKMSDKKEVNKEEFNKGHEIKYFGKLEINSLSFQEVANQAYNLLNPINPKTNERQYNYYIDEMHVDYIIAEEWVDYKTLWLIPYSIENDTVVLDSEDNWVKGYKGFIPEGVDMDQLINDLEINQKELTDLNRIISELKSKKEDLETMADNNKDQVKELEQRIADLEKKEKELNDKINELNEQIVNQKEELNQKDEAIKEKEKAIEELNTYKEKVEKAEREAKQKELNEKYSKILSEKTFKSDEVKQAIEACDVQKLNEIAVAEIAQQKEETKDKKNGDVVINSKDQGDLVPYSDVREKLY